LNFALILDKYCQPAQCQIWGCPVWLDHPSWRKRQNGRCCRRREGLMAVQLLEWDLLGAQASASRVL